jgi:protein tyrosine phosphatase (PTP) superfamily phosphohydrolase (DUF442 family)
MAGITKRAKRAVRRVTGTLRSGLIQHSPDWLKRSLGPSAIYLDMLLVDHGIFRILYLNKHRLSHNAWRAAQPAPFQLRRAARRGIRTIVNLRGERVCGSYVLEKKACRDLGLNLVNYIVRSRAAPTRAELHGAREMLRSVEYPILIHCKSGADRAGLMSVLYRIEIEGIPIEAARRELSPWYGHFRTADTGVLDAFFERYLADNARSPMPFWQWVDEVYDADELKRTFQANGWANRIVNNILKRE